MCGRTACTLSPDDVCSACTYQNRNGKRQQPLWRDPPGGQQYYPSYNVAPASYTPVILSSRHYQEELGALTERVVQPMRWGLVPSWHKGTVKDVAYETNNCRAEGMLEKRTYKVPLEKGQRCVVLADGFYEWKRSKDQKQPYYIYFPQSTVATKQEVKPGLQDALPEIKTEFEQDPVDAVYKTDGIKHDPGHSLKATDVKTDGQLYNPTQITPEQQINVDLKIKTEPVETKMGTHNSFMKEENLDVGDAHSEKNTVTDEWQGRQLLTMAGVFDIWNSPDGTGPVYSYSTITVDASPAMSFIHHRMPALLTSEQEIEDWIDFGRVPLSKAAKLIRPVEKIQLHPVSSEVNNSRNKSPDCIKPVDLKKPKQSGSSKLMMNWLVKAKTEGTVKSEASPMKKFKTN